MKLDIYSLKSKQPDRRKISAHSLAALRDLGMSEDIIALYRQQYSETSSQHASGSDLRTGHLKWKQ
ncbi:hypothetical protein ACFSM5_08620 [Lacibacterium aquatile]|uniref:Uncharacterized protein n=1 Tax=Lacibacterium aquatile TaxID=1168082 RepID=A0ABW5DPL0_9PROT